MIIKKLKKLDKWDFLFIWVVFFASFVSEHYYMFLQEPALQKYAIGMCFLVLLLVVIGEASRYLKYKLEEREAKGYNSLS